MKPRFCSECGKKYYGRGYCRNHWFKYIAKYKYQNKYQRESGITLRKALFAILGQECVCCGESIIELLTVEHKNNDGAEHKKRFSHTYGRYRDMLKDPLIKEKYETRCHNCNWGKAKYGVCPHEKFT